MSMVKTLICPAIAISHKEVLRDCSHLYYYGQIKILLSKVETKFVQQHIIALLFSLLLKPQNF